MEVLKFKQEAKKWIEALPVGNGKMGVMAYGSFSNERLAVNDSSLWSGYPKNQNSATSLQNFDKVRKLLDEKKYHKADKLAEQTLKGGYSESYLPLGDINLKFNGLNNNEYQRKLDLGSAIISASAKGQNSELFANYPSNVCCYKIESESKFSCQISLSSKLKSETFFDKTFNLVGNAPDFVMPNYVANCLKPVIYDNNQGMAFCLCIKGETDGIVENTNTQVLVSDATNLTIYFTTKTGFVAYDKMPLTDGKMLVSECQKVLSSVSYNKLKAEHIADYSQIYSKNKLSISTSNDAYVDELLSSVQKDSIPSELIELFYNFGKYLLIAGSREGGQALNLQGIWNEDIRPAWSSNYTVNINTEMNYWPVSKCNLDECLMPFARLVYELSIAGKQTAKVNYGLSGACCNHNTDIWRKTSPVIGSCNYMFAPFCGAWLANELYSHYKNSNLTSYKDKMLEILTNFASFASDYLVKKDGYYMAYPSTSPEAMFYDKFSVCSLTVASSFDMAIIKQLFKNYLEIADGDCKLAVEVKQKLDNMPPFKDGKLGIQEFYDDKRIVDKGHRHFSPLYAFYPGNLIDYSSSEMPMIKKLYESRVSHSKNHIGWSAGWGICLGAKLRDKQSVQNIMYSLFTKSVFSNLFDAHFPNIFQIDGNYGFVAGINEMLATCEEDVIELLPIVIKNFENGSIKGYKINGSNLSFEWQNGLVTKIECDRDIKIKKCNISSQVIIGKNVTLVGGTN